MERSGKMSGTTPTHRQPRTLVALYVVLVAMRYALSTAAVEDIDQQLPQPAWSCGGRGEGGLEGTGGLVDWWQLSIVSKTIQCAQEQPCTCVHARMCRVQASTSAQALALMGVHLSLSAAHQLIDGACSSERRAPCSSSSGFTYSSGSLGALLSRMSVSNSSSSVLSKKRLPAACVGMKFGFCVGGHYHE